MLGLASGLPPALIEPFVRSLRATGYRGQIGFVLAHYSRSERGALEELADFTIDVDASYAASAPGWVARCLRRLQTTRGLRRTYSPAFMLCVAAGGERTSLERWRNLEFALEGLQSLRYHHYYEVIQKFAPGAEQILLTDLRDVLFQRDPFAPDVERLELFLEDPSRTIGREPFNRRWIKELYGTEVLAAMEDFTASCSGTVIGPRDEILDYLAAMEQAISWRRRPLGNHDQGVHNYLVRSGRFPSAAVVANGTGRVLTMGGMGDVRLEGGRVLNDDGTLPAVLHQYDRHEALARKLVQALAGGEGNLSTSSVSEA